MKKKNKSVRSKACSESVTPPRRQRTLTIRGQRWKIRWVPNLGQNLGLCDYDAKLLRIARGQRTKDELDTVVHELLHACLPDTCEEAVHETANALVEALVRLGLIHCCDKTSARGAK